MTQRARLVSQAVDQFIGNDVCKVPTTEIEDPMEKDQDGLTLLKLVGSAPLRRKKMFSQISASH